MRKARERSFLAQPAARSWAPDGYLRPGDAVQVLTAGGAALAADVFHQTPGGLALLATLPTSEVAGAAGAGYRVQARSVFVLSRIGDDCGYAPRPLCFGDRVVVAAHPLLSSRFLAVPEVSTSSGSLYLHSAVASVVLGTGGSSTRIGAGGGQEAGLSHARSRETEWLLASPDADGGLAAGGRPVRLGEPLQLVHAASGAALAWGTNPADVHVRTHRRHEHVSATHEGTQPPAAAVAANTWCLVGAASEEEGRQCGRE